MKGRLQQMIQDILGIHPDKINIIPSSIPLETQIEYFETAKKVKENINFETVLQNANWLFNSDISIADKKWLLAQLASISQPEAYRLIEKYLQNPDNDLADWARLAFIESRILLESEYLNENHIIISSGLGGENNSLRYFVVFKVQNESFTEGQQKLFEIEASTLIEAKNGKVEEIAFIFPYICLTTLLPFSEDLKELFKAIIEASKEYQIKLMERFIITNVKKLTTTEINHFFENQKDEKD